MLLLSRLPAPPAISLIYVAIISSLRCHSTMQIFPSNPKTEIKVLEERSVKKTRGYQTTSMISSITVSNHEPGHAGQCGVSGAEVPALRILRQAPAVPQAECSGPAPGVRLCGGWLVSGSLPGPQVLRGAPNASLAPQAIGTLAENERDKCRGPGVEFNTCRHSVTTAYGMHRE